MTGKEQNERFVWHLETMAKVRGAKNKDYANDTDSLANFRMTERAGMPAWIGIWTRLGDKYARMTEQVRKFMSGEPISFSVGSEGFIDTCIDMANYALLCEIAFTEWQSKQSEGSSIEVPTITTSSAPGFPYKVSAI